MIRISLENINIVVEIFTVKMVTVNQVGDMNERGGGGKK